MNQTKNLWKNMELKTIGLNKVIKWYEKPKWNTIISFK